MSLATSRTTLAPVVPPPPPSVGSAGPKREPQIVVIPEKFYGVALKMKPPFDMLQEEKPAVPPPPPPKPKPIPVPVPTVKAPTHSRWPTFVIIGILLLGVAGGFVYFARDLLFKKPVQAPIVIQTPEPPPPPSNLTATAPSPTSVSLSWKDVGALETGYRIERRESGATYLPLTTLPANSTTFLDGSVREGSSYDYRVIAFNAQGDSAASNEAGAVVPVAVSAPVVPVAPALPPGGLDSDSDGLSDLEETLFGTDLHNPDSDGDGYLDGNEVFHLYDPSTKAPSRLADSNLVKIATAPVGWELLVPSNWITSLLTTDGSQTTIATDHGELFTIRVQDNASHLSLTDWYLTQHPDANVSMIRAFRTKQGLDGIMGTDHLSAFFLWDGKVISLEYDLKNQTFVNFRTVFEMMLNSLKLNGVPVVSVPDAELPGPGLFVGELATSTEAATSSLPLPLETSSTTSVTSTTP